MIGNAICEVGEGLGNGGLLRKYDWRNKMLGVINTMRNLSLDLNAVVVYNAYRYSGLSLPPLTWMTSPLSNFLFSLLKCPLKPRHRTMNTAWQQATVMRAGLYTGASCALNTAELIIPARFCAMKFNPSRKALPVVVVVFEATQTGTKIPGVKFPNVNR